MIAYNKAWLRNKQLMAKAKQWYGQQLLSAEQFAAAEAQYPHNFYSPNLFVKIGLFIFTWISLSAALGLYALMFNAAFNDSGFIDFSCFFFAIASIVSLEFFIKNSRIYHSGTDEALLYAALLAIGFAHAYRLDGVEDPHTMLRFSLIMIPYLLAALIRYADKLVAFALSFFCYAVFFLLIMKTGTMAKRVMPFAFMFLSACVYFIFSKLKRKDRLFFWKECMVIFEYVALFAGYLSGNYFVIRESGILFFEASFDKGQDIPLAFVFYLFTALVPLVYVYFGLKKRNKTLLWAGLILVATAVITFKYYFSTGHTELTITTVGIIMVLIAYAAIKYLKTPKYGITFEEEPDEDSFLKTNVEALIVAQSFSGTSAHPEQAEGFGGGSSGGGGAGGSF